MPLALLPRAPASSLGAQQARHPFRDMAASDGQGAVSARQAPLSDGEIRDTLYRALTHGADPGDSPLLVDEVPLAGGHVRADMIAFRSDAVHVFEIKSDRDRLERLDEQARVYGEIADRVTLVVGWRHAAAALRKVPRWWEVWLAERVPMAADCTRTRMQATSESSTDVVLGAVALIPLREAAPNPSIRPEALAALLPRPDALQLLKLAGADAGYRSKSREIVTARVSEVVPITDVRAALRLTWLQRSPAVRAEVRAARVLGRAMPVLD